MKRKSICLLAGLLIASTAGMATATAFIIKDATSSSISESVTGTLVLAYGEESTWANIESLSPTNPKFSKIQLKAPIRSANVYTDAKLTLTLAAKTDCSIEGLTIKVATKDWQDGSVTESDVVATLNSKTTTYVSNAIGAAQTFYLKYEISQSAYDEYVKLSEASTESQAITQNFGGTLTARYAKVAQ